VRKYSRPRPFAFGRAPDDPGNLELSQPLREQRARHERQASMEIAEEGFEENGINAGTNTAGTANRADSANCRGNCPESGNSVILSAMIRGIRLIYPRQLTFSRVFRSHTPDLQHSQIQVQRTFLLQSCGRISSKRIDQAEAVTNDEARVFRRMRSRASIKGHPIHPALIPFPIAFLVGALAFDAAGAILDRPAWWMTGAYLALAGVGTALVAAIPGFIDYLFTIPPRSSAKTRATKHLLLNLSAVAVFVLAWVLRGDAADRPEVFQLLLEATGIGLLTMGGWMGGTLAFRNQIGVDHRYAGAGKWTEEYVRSGRDGTMIVGRAGELEIDQMKLVHVNGRRVVVARTADGYVAFGDRCTHRGGSLAGGTMICGTVQCPWHGSQFDVASGAVKAGPAKDAIETFRVEKKGDRLQLIVGS
jgi:uncharacterized membrane protein/nitrite reductase/ring-hydroxylating ferredoxin subunit